MTRSWRSRAEVGMGRYPEPWNSCLTDADAPSSACSSASALATRLPAGCAIAVRMVRDVGAGRRFIRRSARRPATLPVSAVPATALSVDDFRSSAWPAGIARTSAKAPAQTAETAEAVEDFSLEVIAPPCGNPDTSSRRCDRQSMSAGRSEPARRDRPA